MPTYAILGGTGNIGGELIELLARDPDVVLHIYARSKPKLLEAHPVLGDSSAPHKVFAGDLDDVELLGHCIKNASAIFAAVGTNANNPNVKLAERQAKVIIATLSKMKEDASRTNTTFPTPVTVFVTSAGMASDKRVSANLPGYLHWLAQRVAKYIYIDFRVAVRLFQRPENTWIPVVFFCPPGIMPGPSQGEIRIGVDIPKKAPPFVTYADLARGLVQVGHEEERWVGKEIGIVGAKEPPIDYGLMLFYCTTGVLCTWAPPIWRVGNRRGWWGNK